MITVSEECSEHALSTETSTTMNAYLWRMDVTILQMLKAQASLSFFELFRALAFPLKLAIDESNIVQFSRGQARFNPSMSIAASSDDCVLPAEHSSTTRRIPPSTLTVLMGKFSNFLPSTCDQRKENCIVYGLL